MDSKTKINENISFLRSKYAHLLFIGLLFLILVVFFFKIAFLDYAPPASDSIQWRASAEPLIEYNKTHHDQALWSSNLFSGMPGYLIQLSAKYPYLNDLRRFTDKLINWRIFLLFTAGLGVYLLMIFLGFEPIIAFICAIAFPLSSHFLGLIEIGHNTKFRAIVYIPWIFFAVHYLKEKRNLLGLGLTTLFIIGQLRENHPQISYYTFIMLAIIYLLVLYTLIFQHRRLSQMVEKKELHYGKALNWFLENLRGFFYGLSHFSGAGLAKPLLLTFLSWLAMGLNFYIFTRIFAIPISYIHLLFLYPLVSLAQLLPVTVAGFGTRELALLYCFSHYGVPAQKTVAFSLLYFFIWFISMVIPGVIISFSAPFKERRES